MTQQPYHIGTIGIGTMGIDTVGHTTPQGMLYAMGKPDKNDLENSLRSIRDAGVDKILCLLEPKEADLLELSDEGKLTVSLGMAFQRFSIPDFGVPAYPDFVTTISSVSAELRNGTNVLVHCRGGVGRTGLICCAILIKQGMSSTDSIARVSTKRTVTVPETQPQTEMLKRYEKDTRQN